MKNFKIHFGLLLTLCSILSITADNSLIKNLTSETGLSSNYIRTIYKDSKGLIWIGTDTGLDSYDGLQIINYGKRFKTPLKGAVQSILESSNYTLWIGNEQGAFLYNKTGNYIGLVNFNKSTINVRKIFRATNKNIYFATDRGLYILDSLNFKAYPIKLKNYINEPPSLTGIIEDSHHKLWIGSFDGLYNYNLTNKQAEFYRISSIYEANKIRSILYTNKDKIILGTESGAYAFNIKNKSFTTLSGTENKLIISLERNKEDLFIGTERDGILIKNLQSNTFTPFINSSTPIFSILYDKNGLLWSGTFTEGVKYYNLRRSSKFITKDITNKYKIDVRSIYFSPNGYIYIGSRNGFYIMTSDFKIKKTFLPFKTTGLRSRIITTICPYPGNNNLLLIGTFGGGAAVYEIKSNQFYDISNISTFQKGTIYKFITDNNNNIWIATLNGLYKYNIPTKLLKRYDLSKVIGNNELFDLEIDKSNRLWIATRIGVCFYSLKNKNFVVPGSSKSYQYQCSSIYTDKSNNTWFCFNKGGVLQLDSKLRKKQWFTAEIGLPENAPSSLIEDKNNNIWIGTQKGLFKVSKTGEIHAYGYEDGLTGLIFCPESATKDAKGNLWWGNERGLVNYNSTSSSINKSQPNLLFTDFYINGARFSADTLDFIKHIAFNKYKILITGRTKNNLEFRVASLNYHDTKKNLYSFYIDDIDKTWSKPTENNLISYKDLPIGKHNLKISASNNEGVSATQPLEIEIEIIPYIYESNLFFFLIIIILSGITFYYTRSYFIQAMKKIKTQFEETKTKQRPEIQMLKISESKSKEIRCKLISYMSEKKPFLNTNLKQADVARALGYSVNEISQILNTQVHQNFSDFINSYRVEEVKERIASGIYSKYTVSAIAEQCGFNSKTTFYRAFKKLMEVSPSEYFKGLNVE